jgi:hypothetical protein
LFRWVYSADSATRDVALLSKYVALTGRPVLPLDH